MEEMRGAAMAYYANMSIDQQQKLLSFYKSLDTNGDGKVSIQEYLDFLVKKGYTRFVPPNLFKLLDENNDGTLNFDECVTFFYMINGLRLVICDECGSYLWGLYFLCSSSSVTIAELPTSTTNDVVPCEPQPPSSTVTIAERPTSTTNDVVPCEPQPLWEQLPHRAAEAVVQAIALKALDLYMLILAKTYATGARTKGIGNNG
ncbi:hypothetical protein C3L33_15115, partial [Rhododendron williamsianum]